MENNKTVEFPETICVLDIIKLKYWNFVGVVDSGLTDVFQRWSCIDIDLMYGKINF